MFLNYEITSKRLDHLNPILELREQLSPAVTIKKDVKRLQIGSPIVEGTSWDVCTLKSSPLNFSLTYQVMRLEFICHTKFPICGPNPIVLPLK